jgi:hypothetical protein
MQFFGGIFFPSGLFSRADEALVWQFRTAVLPFRFAVLRAANYNYSHLR